MIKNYKINVQCAIKKELIPEKKQLRCWAEQALLSTIAKAELTIRIVNEEEIRDLNSRYRHKNKTTNVLSFPAHSISPQSSYLGDIAICASVVNRESKEQNKAVKAHWAHMVVHSVLHLLGYDHDKKQEAKKMEANEIKILNHLGFNNPYS